MIRCALAVSAICGMALIFSAVSCGPTPQNDGRPAPDVASCGPGAAESCPDADVIAVWVFLEDDCLRCQGFPRAIREARAQLGRDRVAFVAVHVGDDGVPAWLPEYFARDRMDPIRIESVSSDAQESLFGGDPVPLLYLVRDDCIRWALTEGESTSRVIVELAEVDASELRSCA